jgi:hypothetical protein
MKTTAEKNQILKTFIQACHSEIVKNGWSKIIGQIHTDFIFAKEVYEKGQQWVGNNYILEVFAKRCEEHTNLLRNS